MFRTCLASALLAGTCGMMALADAPTQVSAKEALALLNKDGDTTFEIVEVIDWGTALFSAINPDGDTTLEPDETEGRLSDADWAAANQDGDQTLELDEWLGIVRARFTAADANADGKLDETELDSPAGQSLLLTLVK